MDGLKLAQGRAKWLFASNYALPRGMFTKIREFAPDRRISGGFGGFAGFGIGNSRCKPLGFDQQNTEKRIERE